MGEHVSKEAVWQAIVEAVEARTAAAHERFAGLQVALESEGKSTAGDKHETGRAMVQQEMERAADAVSQAEELARQLQGREPASGPVVAWGSWVVSDVGHVVIAAPLGAVDAAGIRLQVISPAAPLAQALLVARAQAGAQVEVNGRKVNVISVA